MEPLDTEVKGDPETFTALCAWLRGTAANAEEAEQSFQTSQTTSEAGGWVGEAGEAFRGLAERGARTSLDMVQAVSGVCSSMEIHADDLRTVRAMMQRARDVATEGGLALRGHEILPPGPAPKAPGDLPDEANPQQQRDHATAQQAEADYVRKVQAYEQAAELVAEAKKKETDSQHVVIRSVSSVLDPIKGTLSFADGGSGVAAAIAARTSKYTTKAASVKSASLPAKLAQNPTMSAWGRFQAAEMAATRSTEKAAHLANAYPNKIAVLMDKYVPDRVNQFLDMKLLPRKTPTPANPLLKGATKVGRSVPLIGTVATGAGVAYDIEEGKDPTQAVVSGGASLASATLAGAAIGGPVGAGVGALVGIGVGLAVDETWNLFD